MQKSHNYSALATELRLFCSKPSISLNGNNLVPGNQQPWPGTNELIKNGINSLAPEPLIDVAAILEE